MDAQCTAVVLTIGVSLALSVDLDADVAEWVGLGSELRVEAGSTGGLDS
jgi:hypothetical protein